MAQSYLVTAALVTLASLAILQPTTATCGYVNSTAYPGYMYNFTSMVLPTGDGFPFRENPYTAATWTINFCNAAVCGGSVCKDLENWMHLGAEFYEHPQDQGIRMIGDSYFGHLVVDIFCDYWTQLPNPRPLSTFGFGKPHGAVLSFSSPAGCKTPFVPNV